MGRGPGGGGGIEWKEGWEDFKRMGQRGLIVLEQELELARYEGLSLGDATRWPLYKRQAS